MNNTRRKYTALFLINFVRIYSRKKEVRECRIKHLFSFPYIVNSQWKYWLSFNSKDQEIKNSTKEYWNIEEIKEINRLRKDRLLSKRMSNIYLKATFEKNWRSRNLNFPSLKNVSPGLFLGSLNSPRHHWMLKFPVET